MSNALARQKTHKGPASCRDVDARQIIRPNLFIALLIVVLVDIILVLVLGDISLNN